MIDLLLVPGVVSIKDAAGRVHATARCVPSSPSAHAARTGLPRQDASHTPGDRGLKLFLQVEPGEVLIISPEIVEQNRANLEELRQFLATET
jgi:hypothetical protein